MTLRQFEQSIKRFVPNFHIMEAGYGDVAGAFIGRQYLFRLNKGEIPLYGYSKQVVIGKQPRLAGGKMFEEPIYQNVKKRGRMQALNLLVNYRYLTQRQAQQVMWGVNA